KLNRLVLVAVIDNRTVVAGHNYKSISFYSQPFNSFHYLSHRPVKFKNDVAPRSHSTPAFKPAMRDPRDMDVVGCEVKEEWIIVVVFDKLNCLCSNHIGHILINPESRLPSCHVSDSAYAVYYGHVVPVAGMHFQQFRI